MVRTLIFDRQATAADELRRLLMAHARIVIAGQADTLDSARGLLGRSDHELVFIDAQFAGEATFDLVTALRPGARAIFLATHGGFALRAFEVNALDYLLKPVQPARLATALARLLPPSPAPIGPGLRMNPMDTVLLDLGKTSRFVTLGDISLIEAHQNYSRVHLADGPGGLVRRTLRSWADMLPACFVRVHRGAMVNLERVVGFERTPRAVALKVAGATAPVVVSRMCARGVKAQLHSRHPWP